MSGVHLFAGDELTEGRYGYPGGYVAVCGALVRPCGARGEGDDPTYCPACLDAAADWNARAGREVAAALT